MKTKIRAIITKLRGIEDDLIDLLSEPTATTESTTRNITSCNSENDSDIDALLDLLDGPRNRSGGYNGESQLKDSFHELSEALAKANGSSVEEAGKHIHYEVPVPIRPSHDSATKPLGQNWQYDNPYLPPDMKLGKYGPPPVEIPILVEEILYEGDGLTQEEASMIPEIPKKNDLLAALKEDEYPTVFERDAAKMLALAKQRVKDSHLLREPIPVTKPLTPEELEAQITKVIHLKEIAAQHQMARKVGCGPAISLQKREVKHPKNKDIVQPSEANPPKKIGRTAQGSAKEPTITGT